MTAAAPSYLGEHAHCRFCGADMGTVAVMLEPLDWMAHFAGCDAYKAAKASAPQRKFGNCLRCCGTGKMPKFRHIENGTCFACGGTGNVKGRQVVPD